MSESLSILAGIASATSFGSGDFAGGFATKRNNVFLVLFGSQFAGLILVSFFVIFFQETIAPTQIILGAMSGLTGAIGLLVFYRGLAIGNMSIVASITSVIVPVLPLSISIINSFQYTIFQIIGILLGLIAIFLVSYSPIDKKFQISDLKHSFVAGIGFGLFLVFIDLASSENSFFFPLVFARISSIVIVFVILLLTKRFEPVTVESLSIIFLAGILDTLGNIFFIFSSEFGRLDIASILTSMGPATTVFLAWVIIKEKISSTQLVGIVLAILAVISISI